MVLVVCGGAWLCMVAVAIHGGDGHLCVAVHVVTWYYCMYMCMVVVVYTEQRCNWY